MTSFFHENTGLKQAKSEFKEWYLKNKPDVILSYHDYVPKFLKQLGRSIPKDVGYVDLMHIKPDAKFAGIHLDGQHVGYATFDLVFDQINRNEKGEPDFAKLTLVYGSWLDGDSVREQS